MRRTLTILVFIFGLVCSEDVLELKGANVKPVVATKTAPEAKTVTNAKVQVAQKRQDTYGAPAADTYGAPAAPAVDTYGPPKAPPVDTYGSPQAEPTSYEPAPAPVQGEVGTQGYYYYYYPVASGATDTKTTYSAPAESSGGLGGGSTGLLIALVVGVLIIGGIAALATVTGRSMPWDGYSLDSDVNTTLAHQVHNAIELYQTLYQ